MLFDRWRAEAAQIAAGWYSIDLDRIPKSFLWRLFVDHVPPYEAAKLAKNLIGAQEDQPSRLTRGRRPRLPRKGWQPRAC
jgi:hypothetical protein